MKIVTIVGARPQFVKAAAMSREFNKYINIKEVILHTGQHFDKNMSDVFFDEMQIPHPKYNLNINSLSHGAMTGRMIEKIEEILLIEKPDYLLVYGDTNSTLAGALAAKKMNISVIHIEAGLRSFDMNMPEEINRILTDRISNILFCPTETAVRNLENEGFNNYSCQVVKVGDVMQDAALFYEKKALENSDILTSNNLKGNDYYLCTIHREENTNNLENLNNIVDGLNHLSDNFKILVPVHPRTKKILETFNLNNNVKIIPPVGYFDMINLIKNSRLVITDSGGLQKEAYFFNKFCVTTRNQTEWIELVENGYNMVVGANSKKLIHSVKFFESMQFDKSIELYGGGNASNNIVKKIIKHFDSK